jgi:hypothetical protein
MKKWKKRFIAVATTLGFLPKVKDGTLSADEQRQIWTAYEQKYKTTFVADRQADEDDSPDDGDGSDGRRVRTAIQATAKSSRATSSLPLKSTG